MADPVAVPCPVDEYTKVATAVTGGTLMITDFEPSVYTWTYKMTGNPAPTNTDLTNAAIMDNQQAFGFAAAVDIYVSPRARGGYNLLIICKAWVNIA